MTNYKPLVGGYQVPVVTTCYGFDAQRSRLWTARITGGGGSVNILVSCYDFPSSSFIFQDVTAAVTSDSNLQEIVIASGTGNAYLSSGAVVRELDASTGAELNSLGYTFCIVYGAIIRGTKLYIAAGKPANGPAILNVVDLNTWTVVAAANLRSGSGSFGYSTYFSLTFDGNDNLWITAEPDSNPQTHWYLTRVNTAGPTNISNFYTDVSYWFFDYPTTPYGPPGASWYDASNNCLWLLTTYSGPSVPYGPAYLLKWDLATTAIVSAVDMTAFNINAGSTWGYIILQHQWSQGGLDQAGNIWIPGLKTPGTGGRSYDPIINVIDPSTATLVTSFLLLSYGADSGWDWASSPSMMFFPATGDLLAYDNESSPAVVKQVFHAASGIQKHNRFIIMNS